MYEATWQLVDGERGCGLSQPDSCIGHTDDARTVNCQRTHAQLTASARSPQHQLSCVMNPFFHFRYVAALPALLMFQPRGFQAVQGFEYNGAPFSPGGAPAETSGVPGARRPAGGGDACGGSRRRDDGAEEGMTGLSAIRNEGAVGDSRPWATRRVQLVARGKVTLPLL